PSMAYRSSNPKIYALPAAKRRALSSWVIFSPTYRIILVPAWIFCAAKSPCPAMRDGATCTRIFTTVCLLMFGGCLASCVTALHTKVILFHQRVLAQLLGRAAFELDPAVHDDIAPVRDLDRLMEVLLSHQHGQLVLLLQLLDFGNQAADQDGG